MKLDYDELNDWGRQMMWVVIALFFFYCLFITSYLEFGWVGAVFSVLQIGGILAVVCVVYLTMSISCWEWHVIKNG